MFEGRYLSSPEELTRDQSKEQLFIFTEIVEAEQHAYV